MILRYNGQLRVTQKSRLLKSRESFHINLHKLPQFMSKYLKKNTPTIITKDGRICQSKLTKLLLFYGINHRFKRVRVIHGKVC